MFKLILVTVLLGLAAADHIDKNAETVELTNIPADADGNYAVIYKTTNGIAAQESGNVAGVSGAFQYVSPDGTPILVTYTADQDGYHPNGDHLPTPPPIPEAIVKSIEYIRTHPSIENGILRRN